MPQHAVHLVPCRDSPYIPRTGLLNRPLLMRARLAAWASRVASPLGWMVGRRRAPFTAPHPHWRPLALCFPLTSSPQAAGRGGRRPPSWPPGATRMPGGAGDARECLSLCCANHSPHRRPLRERTCLALAGAPRKHAVAINLRSWQGLLCCVCTSSWWICFVLMRGARSHVDTKAGGRALSWWVMCCARSLQSHTHAMFELVQVSHTCAHMWWWWCFE